MMQMPLNTILSLLLIPIFFSVSNLSCASAQIFTACNRTCGRRDVPYPFGFSDGCDVLLECTRDGISVRGFPVLNITSAVLLLDIPPACNRRVSDASMLFGPNFAPISLNGLLLKNCTANISNSGCSISTSLLEERRFELRNCGSKREEDIKCYSQNTKGEFLEFSRLNATGCKVLFSSVTVVNGSEEGSVMMEFGKMKVGWWVEGSCRTNRSCSAHANCSEVVSPVNRSKGFRCQCFEGYEGDGFVEGVGCRKVSTDCDPSKVISGGCGRAAQISVLIGGIVTGVFLMAAMVFVCSCVQRRLVSRSSRRIIKRLLSKAVGSPTVPFYSYQEMVRATEGFSEKKRLGTGAYGIVYAGKIHNEEWVAVKRIRHRDNDTVEQVVNEIKLISSVRHPNLVRLLGCCIEKGEHVLVYEFMPNGTLAQHLQMERGSGLPWTTRLKIVVDTANAIAHLHSAINPPIYHRDIKSSNILLDYSFNTKVADFGLSRIGLPESSHISTAPQGTPGYLDPQYHQDFQLSDKSDVYSFGVVLVEIISAMKVVDFSREHGEVNLAALAIDRIGRGCMDELIDPFLEPNRDDWTLSSIHKVAELAFRCLAYHRDMRPSMVEVEAELERIKLSLWVQMEEEPYLGSSDSCCTSPPLNAKNMLWLASKKSMEMKRLVKDSSPVSVDEPWFSEQSSPSSNSLLGNATQ